MSSEEGASTQDQQVDTLGLYFLTKLANEGKMTSWEWLEKAHEWATKMNEELNKIEQFTKKKE